MLRAPSTHRPFSLALPPRALFFCVPHPRNVILARTMRVGEQYTAASWGAVEI